MTASGSAAAPTPSAAGVGRIGIIGGSGPEAGVDLFVKVLSAHRAKLGAAYTGDASAPNILLTQVSAIGGGSAEEKWAALSSAVLEVPIRTTPLLRVIYGCILTDYL